MRSIVAGSSSSRRMVLVVASWIGVTHVSLFSRRVFRSKQDCIHELNGTIRCMIRLFDYLKLPIASSSEESRLRADYVAVDLPPNASTAQCEVRILGGAKDTTDTCIQAVLGRDPFRHLDCSLEINCGEGQLI